MVICDNSSSAEIRVLILVLFTTVEIKARLGNYIPQNEYQDIFIPQNQLYHVSGHRLIQYNKPNITTILFCIAWVLFMVMGFVAFIYPYAPGLLHRCWYDTLSKTKLSLK